MQTVTSAADVAARQTLTARDSSAWPFDLLDFLELTIDSAAESRLYAAALAEQFNLHADNARHAAITGDEQAQTWLGRLTALRARLAAIPETARLLSLEEAARKLNLVRPNGKPRDSAYTAIRHAGGQMIAGKWTITEDRLNTFIRKGRP